jgi:hypothetical protein
VRPDSLEPRQFYGDSKLFMDTLLKPSQWKRSVGREEVRITSMGKAQTEVDFVDNYGRKWKQWTWQAEHQDAIHTAVVLPTPDGYVGFARWSKTAGQHDAEIDLRSTTNFVLVALSGTFKQWQEYLGLAELLPRTLAGNVLTIEYRQAFRDPHSPLQLQLHAGRAEGPARQ